MHHLDFPPEVVAALHYERFHHPHPQVQAKMEVLYLKSQGLEREQIQQLCAISKATYYRYVESFRTGGVAGLKAIAPRVRANALQAQREPLEAYLVAHPPATVAQAQAALTELTGIQRGPTQVRHFLHTLGMKPRKVGTLPARADVEAQEQFKKKVWSRV